MSEFVSKFESLIRQNDYCDDSVALTEAEIRFTFYAAIHGAFLEITQTDIVYRQTNNKEMTYQQLKNSLLQIEAEKRSESMKK